MVLDAAAWVTVGAALAYVVARAVFAPGRVTYHRITGAVLLYLTIGQIFVGLYGMVDLVVTHSLSGVSVAEAPKLLSDLIYFSFSMLTTVGYGDIVPVHPVARSLSSVEAIIGQLYPATLLARLVTLELEDRRRYPSDHALVQSRGLGAIERPHEHLVYLRMANGIAGCIGYEILLRYIGDIFDVGVFGEEMIEGLVLARPELRRNRLPPFLGISEDGVDVIDDSPERIFPVLDI